MLTKDTKKFTKNLRQMKRPMRIYTATTSNANTDQITKKQRKNARVKTIRTTLRRWAKAYQETVSRTGKAYNGVVLLLSALPQEQSISWAGQFYNCVPPVYITVPALALIGGSAFLFWPAIVGAAAASSAGATGITTTIATVTPLATTTIATVTPLVTGTVAKLAVPASIAGGLAYAFAGAPSVPRLNPGVGAPRTIGAFDARYLGHSNTSAASCASAPSASAPMAVEPPDAPPLEVLAYVHKIFKRELEVRGVSCSSTTADVLTYLANVLGCIHLLPTFAEAFPVLRIAFKVALDIAASSNFRPGTFRSLRAGARSGVPFFIGAVELFSAVPRVKSLLWHKVSSCCGCATYFEAMATSMHALNAISACSEQLVRFSHTEDPWTAFRIRGFAQELQEALATCKHDDYTPPKALARIALRSPRGALTKLLLTLMQKSWELRRIAVQQQLTEVINRTTVDAARYLADSLTTRKVSPPKPIGILS